MVPFYSVMKHYAFILSVISFVFLFGCSSHEKDLLKTEKMKFENVTPLFEGAPVAFTLNMDIEWPVDGPDDNTLKKMQKGITSFLFGNDIQTTDIEHAMWLYNKKSSDNYQEENMEFMDELEGEWSYMMDWEEYITGNFMQRHNGMISYIRYMYGYSGGAHGMGTRDGRTFRIDNGDVVTIKDILKDGYDDQLTAALRKNLPLYVEDMDMLFETEIFPSESFYISPEGLTYIYQPYEIGPYALGLIEITIPWNEIQNIIR